MEYRSVSWDAGDCIFSHPDIAGELTKRIMLRLSKTVVCQATRTDT